MELSQENKKQIEDFVNKLFGGDEQVAAKPAGEDQAILNTIRDYAVREPQKARRVVVIAISAMILTNAKIDPETFINSKSLVDAIVPLHRELESTFKEISERVSAGITDASRLGRVARVLGL